MYKTKISNILIIAGLALSVIFAIGMLSVQASVPPERHEVLIGRLQLLGVVSDNLEVRKNELRAIIEDIERQQTELTREADGHRRELAGVQTDFQ